MKSKITVTALAIRTALLISIGCTTTVPVFAAEEADDKVQTKEENDAKKVDVKEGNVIVITGIRGSLKDNLNQKRQANSVMDFLNTEDIAKNPDKNMAEALQRIAGIQITRDFGEGAKVSIRGTSPEFTKTLINGQEALSAEWLPAASVIKNGAFDFSSMPSEQISRIEVYKSSQADIESGGIGGTVILRTKTPLELDNGYGRIALDNEYNSGSEVNSPQMSGTYNWVNDDETLGAIINLSYQERNLLRNSNEVAQGWFDYYRSAREIALWQDYRAWWIREGNIPGYPMAGQFEQKRERLGIDATFEYAPTDDWNMTLNHRVNNSKMGNQSHALLARTFQMSRQLYRSRPVGFEYTADDPGLVSGGFGDYVASIDMNLLDARNGWAGDRAVYFEFQDRDGTKTTSAATTFKSEYQTDNLTWELWFGETSGDSTIKDRGTHFRLNTDASADAVLSNIDFHYDYDPNNQVISWGLSDEGILTNPGSAYVVSSLTNNHYDVDNSSRFFKTDLEWHLDNDFYITSVKVGTKLRTKKRSSLRSFTYVDFIDGNHPLAGDWASGTVSGIFTDRDAMPTTYADYSHQIRQDYINGLPVVAPGDCTTTCLIDNGPYAPNQYNQKEEYTAAYALANFGGEIKGTNFRGNIGVRMVSVDTTSTVYKSIDGVITPYTSKGDTTDYLPSFNLAISLSENVILRTAAAVTVARPSLSQLTSQITLSTDPANRTGSSGNPDLNPYSSEEFELGLEWYFDEASLVSLTSFRKNLKDYIATVQIPEAVNIDAYGEHFEGNYLISRPENVTENTIQGWEFQLQHDFGNNFGVLFNYTYTDVPDVKYEETSYDSIEDDSGNVLDWQIELDADGNPVTIEREIVLPGNSKKTYNLSGYYEDGNWSARLSYNYRGAYFRYADSGGQNIHDEREQLDFKLTYEYNDHLSFAFSVLNLTDEQSRIYIVKKQLEPDPDYPDLDPRYFTDRVEKLQEDFYDSGRRYYVGANYKF